MGKGIIYQLLLNARDECLSLREDSGAASSKARAISLVMTTIETALGLMLFYGLDDEPVYNCGATERPEHTGPGEGQEGRP